ncbi:NAD(P)H-dependent oxidoreductase [Planotetraspora sp. GP83]|uniref:NAD(P)H-dependent oxidoreductase n=1 Tax=Planotetraspora sp. GP83 TaxID=3156264 RepID=UPI0035170FCF
MKTLIVYAHPEPKSLNSSLKDHAVSTLETAGHEVRVTDLYAMNWKAVVDAEDFGPNASNPLHVAHDSGRAFDAGTLTPDILAEQEKLLWADTIIMQFPMWWYTMPAILKGWVERVFTFNFAYGVGEHTDVSTRVRVRPRFEEALRTAREVKAHAPHCRVIFTVYEMKRLRRDAAELTALADHLTAHGLVLEMLAGPLPGIYDPTGPGKLLFAFFAGTPSGRTSAIRLGGARYRRRPGQGP